MSLFKTSLIIVTTIAVAIIIASCSGGGKSITSPSPDNPLSISQDASANIGVSDWFSDGSPAAHVQYTKYIAVRRAVLKRLVG